MSPLNWPSSHETSDSRSPNSRESTLETSCSSGRLTSSDNVKITAFTCTGQQTDFRQGQCDTAMSGNQIPSRASAMAATVPRDPELDTATGGMPEYGMRSHMHRQLDAESTPSVAAKVLMRLGVKVKVLIEPANVLIAGRSRLAGASLPGTHPMYPATLVTLQLSQFFWLQTPQQAGFRYLPVLSLPPDAPLHIIPQIGKKMCLQRL